MEQIEVLSKGKAKFRIVIYELSNGKSITISLRNGTTLRNIKSKIIDCFNTK